MSNEPAAAWRLRVMAQVYPHRGFCEYLAAPQYAIVKLADEISFEEAARLGYLGTAYAALRKLGSIAGKSIVVNGSPARQASA
ncbi:MAG: hypothetical protein IPG91_11530 [Ideonella sp.]|nr:hypothetical protein [Ideonella sp.]